jgi:CheY-like chemotaxis protein
VLEASDGQDAIGVAARHPGPIHLLLTDVVMPGMNGCELAAGLTALLPGIKVMFMSAYDRDFLVARGLEPTGPVVTKPFTVEYLSRRVRMVLTDRAPVPARPVLTRAR